MWEVPLIDGWTNEKHHECSVWLTDDWLGSAFDNGWLMGPITLRELQEYERHGYTVTPLENGQWEISTGPIPIQYYT